MAVDKGLRDVSIGKNGKVLRLVLSRGLYLDGAQKYIALGQKDDAAGWIAARLRAIELQQDIDNGEFDPTLSKYRAWRDEDSAKRKHSSERGLTLRELWEFWCGEKEPLLAASTFKQKFKGTHYRAIEAIGGDRLVSAQSARLVRGWVADNRSRQDAVALLGQLEAACDRAIYEGKYHSNNPFRGMGRLLGRSRNRRIDERDVETIAAELGERNYFTAEEKNKILDRFLDAYPHYWLFTYFRFYTGCRFEESIGIEWQDIAEDCKTIIFRRAFSYIGGDVKTTKIGKVRRFNCSQKLAELLLEHRENTKPQPESIVFLGVHGSRILLKYYARMWNRIVNSLYNEGEIEVVLTPKHTRHTFSNLAELAGYSEREIARQCGHSIATRNRHYRDRSSGGDIIEI